MSLICTTVATWITHQVLVPVNTWASQQQKKCNQYPWWDPRGWFCWFVTVLIQVVVWVTQNVSIPTFKFVCNFVTFVVGWFVMIFATIIDAVCSSCNAVFWTNHWFLTQGTITFVSSAPSPTKPGYSDYTFTCHCPNGSSSNIVVTALNDDDAASQAQLACAKVC